MKTEKTRADSDSVMTELVLPNDTNILGNLLGGRLMHWIDVAGAMAAMRHSEGIVATICIDSIAFRCPVKLGNIVTFHSFLTWSGRTSMEVAVDVSVEDVMTGVVTDMTRVYLMFVALHEDSSKKQVPALCPTNDAERADYEAALIRRKMRLAQ